MAGWIPRQRADGADEGRRTMPTPTKLGGEFLVNTYTNFNQSNDAITWLPDGRFVVMWRSSASPVDGADQFSTNVHGQIFNADGSKSGTEFLVNTTLLNGQEDPSITTLAGGGFVATW